MPLLESPKKHSINIIMPQINWKYIALLWVCVSLLAHIIFTHLIIFSVLHPHHKLKYFELAGWEKGWVQTAKGIVRANFEELYAMPADVDVVMLPPASTKEVLFLLGLEVSSFDTNLSIGT